MRLVRPLYNEMLKRLLSFINFLSSLKAVDKEMAKDEDELCNLYQIKHVLVQFAYF